MLINTQFCRTAHGSSAPRDRSACLFRGRSTADLPAMVLPGRRLALSRVQRKTIRKNKKAISALSHHSSSPCLELAIVYGPAVRAGG